MPQKKALVVAIDKYGGTGSNDLPSCINDANAFAEDVLRRIYQFSPDDIRTLHDADATVANVEAELDRLAQHATAEDRLVFYFSGHGFTQLVNNVMEEFIVLRDANGPVLYNDGQFVAKVKDLPPGIFTAVLDMCFSGGAFKVAPMDLFGAQKLEPTLIKALPYPAEALQQKQKSFSLETAPIAYKRFGCAKTDRPAVLNKMLTPDLAAGLGAPKALALSDATEAPQPEMSGLLISACLETETASASNSLTRGLSAFTHALVESLKSPSTPRSAVGLFNTAAAHLKNLRFQQTPMLLERAAPGNLKNRAFITSMAVAELPQEKEFQLQAADEKLFGALVARLAQIVPQVAPIVFDAVAGRRKAFEFGGAAPGAPTDTDEKFIGAVLGTLAQVLPRVAPVVLDAITSRRKALELAGALPTAQEDEKFLNAILGTVAQVIPHVAPMIIEAVAGRRKAVEGLGAIGVTTSVEAEEKFIGSILGAVSRVIPRVAPVIIDAVVGRRKELELLPADTTAVSLQADPKFIGAILGTLGQVIPHVAPLVLDAITTRRKSLAGFGAVETTIEFEADEKFLGSVFRTMASAVSFALPRVVDAAIGRPKAFEGVALGSAVTTDADEKFLGAVLNTVSQIIPHVAPMILDSVFARRKELELETGIPIRADLADEKFLPLLVGAIASAIPHVAPLVVNAVRGRRKELEEEGALGAIGGTQAEEKLFGDILRQTRQVFNCFGGMPLSIPGVPLGFGTPRKEVELGAPVIMAPAASESGAVDEKFLSAVMSALGQVLPVVTPAVIRAVSGRRKELELGGPAPLAPETDEKFLGAVMSALGQVLPIVAPAIITAVSGRRKELELAGPAAAAEADEKFLSTVLSTLGRVLPAVTPVIVSAIRGQRKELAGIAAPTGTADETLVREVMSRLPQELPQWFAAAQPTYGQYRY